MLRRASKAMSTLTAIAMGLALATACVSPQAADKDPRCDAYLREIRAATSPDPLFALLKDPRGESCPKAAAEAAGILRGEIEVGGPRR
jgi:hypothetical protein